MPILYLLVGYPGAGKTTTSQMLHQLTGARHLWADKLRKERFNNPTYSHQENNELYDYMNKQTAELLAQGESVIFDTNFNFYKDRQRLRKIAQDNHAKTVLLWVQAPRDVARQRAITEAHKHHSRILGRMSEEDFDRLTNHLEEPKAEEEPIVVDGTKISSDYLSSLLFNN